MKFYSFIDSNNIIILYGSIIHGITPRIKQKLNIHYHRTDKTLDIEFESEYATPKSFVQEVNEAKSNEAKTMGIKMIFTAKKIYWQPFARAK